MTSWHLCFLRHLALALRGTFFIVVLKWALFDWSSIRHSRDVGRRFYMKKTPSIGKKLSSHVIEICYLEMAHVFFVVLVFHFR